jgi:histidine triad (HIT) family protein
MSAESAESGAGVAQAGADCLFCRIVAGEIPATVVHETPNTVAFRDVDPQAPTHVLIVPRRHVPTVVDLVDRGYRTVFNTGREAHQSVFHAHVHVLGGRSMTWPPG